MSQNTSTGNEGEGNQTDAKRFNEEQAKFAKSGKVPAAAADAKEAFEGPERQALEEAEAEGKSHAKQ